MFWVDEALLSFEPYVLMALAFEVNGFFCRPICEAGSVIRPSTGKRPRTMNDPAHLFMNVSFSTCWKMMGISRQDAEQKSYM